MRIVPYEERFGMICFPEGFEQTLQNLTIEEQMMRYCTTRSSCYSMTHWCERVYDGYATRLEENSDVKALIIKEGIIVGVMMSDDCSCEVPCLAEESVCTFYSSDNNGAGYKERVEYTRLICVPDCFMKEK